MNSTDETLLFDRFLIMYNLCVFTCIIFIFVFHCIHVRMSLCIKLLLTYLLTYFLYRKEEHFTVTFWVHLFAAVWCERYGSVRATVTMTLLIDDHTPEYAPSTQSPRNSRFDMHHPVSGISFLIRRHHRNKYPSKSPYLYTKGDQERDYFYVR